jgi:shikimate dehydrogenase
MKKYGLLGKTLVHSFSKFFFTNFFIDNKIEASYDNFEIKNENQIPNFLIKYADLSGFNVTFPYKKEIIPYIHELDEIALGTGVVNCVKKVGAKWYGYNTDLIGAYESIKNFVPQNEKISALILGSGATSKTMKDALLLNKIPTIQISRNPGNKKDTISYEAVQCMENLNDYKLIINTTPLGTFPNIDECVDFPYEKLTPMHYLYDVVYNPGETLFLKKGRLAGAKTKNGLEMLKIQALESWKIWNE